MSTYRRYAHANWLTTCTNSCSRRVLSDISNKQRNRQRGNNSSGIASAKKVGLGEGLGQSKKLSAKKKTKTPLKTKAVASLTPKAVIEPPEVPVGC